MRRGVVDIAMLGASAMREPAGPIGARNSPCNWRSLQQCFAAVAALDRYAPCVGFAQLGMKEDQAITPSIHGLGAGLFFSAGGIARVNSIGNLSGFLAPFLIDASLDRTGSVHSAFALLPILPFAAMMLTLRIRRLPPAPAGPTPNDARAPCPPPAPPSSMR